MLKLNLILLSLVLGSMQLISSPISLQDALSKKLVTATIHGKNQDSTPGFISSHFGPCIELQLKSLSKTSLVIQIENGRFLETLDTNEQRMIITQQELISLLPNKQKTITIYAMCTQMHDHSPGRESLLALGPMASGNLLELTGFLQKNRFQGQAAQEAVWVITDRNSPGNIYSDDTLQMKKLQQFVCRLTGQAMPKAAQKIEYAEGMVSGEIVFDNKVPDSYTMKLFNEAGEVIVTFFEEKPIDRPLHTTLNWKFRYKGFPKGMYYVKLVNKKQEIISNRPVIVR